MTRKFIILIEKALSVPGLRIAGMPGVDYPGYLVLQSLSAVDTRLNLIRVIANPGISRKRVII